MLACAVLGAPVPSDCRVSGDVELAHWPLQASNGSALVRAPPFVLASSAAAHDDFVRAVAEGWGAAAS